MGKGEESVELMLRKIAHFVAGTEPSEWLITHFRRWLPALGMEIAMSNAMSTRSEALKWLADVEIAARFLRSGLGHQPSRWLLQEEKLGDIPNLSELLGQLKFLEERAQLAWKSPALSTAEGGAQKGPGKAKSEGANNPKVSIAGMIILAWEEVHGRRPGPRNRNSWEAADCLWRLSNNTLKEWGILAKAGKRLKIKKEVHRGEDPLTQWRRHFEAALKQQPILASNHDEFLRHMRIARVQEPTELAV